MLNKTAFANALAVGTAVLYLVFYILHVIAPALFSFVFNAQFLGADVNSLIPADFSFINFIGTLVIVIITAWLAGYLIIWLYNRFVK